MKKTFFDKNEYLKEYISEYNLDLCFEKMDYSIPKIYCANKDPKKRWYVYFSYRNPETGKLEKQSPIYANINRIKDPNDRYYNAKILQKAVLKMLEDGYNPYNKTKLAEAEQKQEAEQAAHQAQNPIYECFDFVLNLKKNSLKENSFRDFRVRINQFSRWLSDNNCPLSSQITDITKKITVQYLNEVLEKTSPKNRNNTRTNLSMLFQALEDNDYIFSNFVKSIPVLRAEPERNKTYSKKQEVDIYNLLKKNDPILLLFVQFISYNHLRPVEVVRLKVKDLNIDEKRIYVRAKNKAVKIKIIPDILLQEIPDLTRCKPEDYLFTPNKIGDFWDTNETDKRAYFGKRFKKIKDELGLGKDYGLYSFRHTFITKLYNSLVEKYTPFEAKSKLMLITGHETMAALEKYLRDIDAVLPEDYSDLIK